MKNDITIEKRNACYRELFQIHPSTDDPKKILQNKRKIDRVRRILKLTIIAKSVYFYLSAKDCEISLSQKITYDEAEKLSDALETENFTNITPADLLFSENELVDKLLENRQIYKEWIEVAETTEIIEPEKVEEFCMMIDKGHIPFLRQDGYLLFHLIMEFALQYVSKEITLKQLNNALSQYSEFYGKHVCFDQMIFRRLIIETEKPLGTI